MKIFRLLLAFFLVAAFSPRAAAAQSLSPKVTEMSLRPGDIVRVVVWRRPELSGEFVVGFDGSIAHPLYHAIPIANVPIGKLDDEFRQFLQTLEANPAFVITPMVRVFVGGEVRTPNVLTIPPGTSVAEAIALGGGLTDRSKLDDVRLVHGGTTTRLTLADGGAAAASTPLQSGDQVLVGRTTPTYDRIVAAASMTGVLLAIVNLVVQLRR